MSRLLEVLGYAVGYVVQFLLYGAVAVAIVLLFFLALGYVIEWPERIIRKLIARFRPKPSPPAEPPRHHNYFDEPV